MERYLIRADDEYLNVPASNVLNALSLVRALRPRATVVGDAYACTPATVTYITITESTTAPEGSN